METKTHIGILVLLLIFWTVIEIWLYLSHNTNKRIYRKFNWLGILMVSGFIYAIIEAVYFTIVKLIL